MKVFWTQEAKKDLKNIRDYILKDSEKYANIVFNKIILKTRDLEKFSDLGRKIIEDEDEMIREVFVFNYRIIYKIFKDRIEIFTIIHTSRNIMF